MKALPSRQPSRATRKARCRAAVGEAEPPPAAGADGMDLHRGNQARPISAFGKRYARPCVRAGRRTRGRCGSCGRCRDEDKRRAILARPSFSQAASAWSVRSSSHTMSSSTARSPSTSADLATTLQRGQPRSALIVGAGYIGLEMAEALTARGVRVTQVEQLPEVLPTVDPELGALVHSELVANGVDVVTEAAVTRIARTASGLRVEGTSKGRTRRLERRPGPRCGRGPPRHRPAHRSRRGDRASRRLFSSTTIWPRHFPQVWAAGDCVVTDHRQLGPTYLPLGTTAHKQGRVAGANAVGIKARFPGIVGTQVVKIFDLVAARTGPTRPRSDSHRLPAHHGGLHCKRSRGLLPSHLDAARDSVATVPRVPPVGPTATGSPGTSSAVVWPGAPAPAAPGPRPRRSRRASHPLLPVGSR